MIVLFHVFYLFGQYLYENSLVRKLITLCDAAKNAQQSSSEQRSYEMLDDNSRDDEDEGETRSSIEQQVPKVFNDRDYKIPLAPKLRENTSLVFHPPAYLQRYEAVLNVLNNCTYTGRIRKVVEFGCAEMNFVRYLKSTEQVEEILCVDIDRHVLKRNKDKAEPLLMEYLCCRKKPLAIELCEGNVIHQDRKLDHTDAVICIELIEHLYPDTIMDMSCNIFEYIMPKVVIITTPNAEFNVLFPNFSGFRHPDHKFEWTRKQFEDWAQDIVTRYPFYIVTFKEICEGPKGTEKLGGCSQMAVFQLDECKKMALLQTEKCNKLKGVDGLFKTVARYDYPVYVDERTDEEKLLHEAIYCINKDASFLEIQEVPLKNILTQLEQKNFNVTMQTLEKVLVDANWVIKDTKDGVIVKMDSFSDASYDGEDEEFIMDNTDLINEENLNELNHRYELDEISVNVSEDLPEQDFYSAYWNEESSIIIPENRSIIQENTYLYDGETSVSENQSSEELHIISNNDFISHSKTNNVTEFLIHNEQELPSNSISSSLNETEINCEAAKINADVPLVFDTSSTISNSSLILKNSSVNSTIELALPQNSDTNLTTPELQVEKDTTVQTFSYNLEPYMSISRLSPPPEPRFFSCESNNSLYNNSKSYQNGSNGSWYKVHRFMNSVEPELNNPLHHCKLAKETMNVKESRVEDISKKNLPKKGCIQTSKIHSLKHAFPNSEEGNSCDLEQMISVGNQIYEYNDMIDIAPLNDYSSSINNQPRFTSSPKASAKTLINVVEQKNLELKEMSAVNRILSFIKEDTEKTVSDTNSSSLENISQKSSSSITTETVKLSSSSLNDNITNTSKNNVDVPLISNNAQQHSCLENEEVTKVMESTRNIDKKFVERDVEINHGSDFSDDVQNVDKHHSLSSNNENVKKEENVCFAVTRANDNTTHQKNVIDDFAQSNVRKKSLNLPKELSSFKLQNNNEGSSAECAKKINVLENDRLVSSSSNKDANNVQFVSAKRSDEIVGTSKDVNASNIVGLINNTEAKSVSPFETPPNSWSPEIMDSGYPNSASVQDITPEYDLSSIAQDHIPDSESPSIAEAPRALGILEPIEVENGDLANNNRDDEGNNMIAVDANDIENLQPFIDVLENDLENENDIYVMQNGFPIWLLRLLDMANPLEFDMQARQNLRDPENEVADDVNYVNRDEGFDSSSSENESDV